MSKNYDDAIGRSWEREGKNLKAIRPFYWTKLNGDKLLMRQFYMMREGRHSLHNLIRRGHGLPNRY